MPLDRDILKGMRRLYGKLTAKKDIVTQDWRPKTVAEVIAELDQEKQKPQQGVLWRDNQKKLFRGLKK